MEKLNRSLKSPIKTDHQELYTNDFNERPYLPDCWNDDKRMDVLFNPFRNRDINPEGWDLKMNFWINLINKWCLYERKVVFTVDEIRHNFIRDQRMPHLDCIKLVISHMKRQNKIIFRDAINLNKNNIKYGPSLANWALNVFIIKPVTFAWSMLSKNDDGLHPNENIIPIQPDYHLINKETLEILSESVDVYIKTLVTTCLSYAKFLTLLNKNAFAEKNTDEATLEVVLDYLESKSKIKIYEESGFKIVKFGNDTNIKESDIILVKLELTKEVLEQEANKLEDQIENFNHEVRTAIKNENKDKALILLRRKKRLENRLKEKDQQIDNIEIICGQLLESGSQQLMVKAFQLANDVLKKNTAKLEDVENIMSQIDENLEDISQLNVELNRPFGEMNRIEYEAEKELEEILKEIEKEKISDKWNEPNQNDLMDKLDNLSIVNDSLNDQTEEKKSVLLPAQ